MPKTDETPKLSETEIEAKRAALIAELDALPTPKVDGNLRPGTKIGDGFTADTVPFTKEFYLDVEARRKDPEFGSDYALHTVTSSETIDITVNGVAFRLIAGLECKLPTPHYLVYKDRLKTLREVHEKYTPPEAGPKPMQVYRIDGPWKKQDLSAE